MIMARQMNPHARRRRIGMAAFIVLGGFVALSSCAADEPSTDSATETTVPAQSTVARKSVTHDFVVPAGTTERLKNGENPELIPREFEVHVGDKIRVRNDDTELVRLGIFNVAPGETVTMNFNKVGPLRGVIFADDSGGCGTPPPKDKEFVINVQP